MVKVILVDDEPNVRLGVKMMIPWEDLGLEVIGEAGDGGEGLEKITELKPDIVIADVKMPVMTGIEMIEKAIQLGYKGKCLILSGYSDFTYAKEAMSLGVKQFILKPVDEDELIEALKTVKEIIISERKSTEKLLRGAEYMNEQLVKALLLGDSEILNSMDFKNYDFPNYDVALISTAPEYSSDERAKLLDMIKADLARRADVEAITTDLSSMLAVLFKGWQRNKIIDYLMKLYKVYSRKIFITVGVTAKGVYSIKQSYFSADTLYKNRFLYLHYGVVTSEDSLSNDESEKHEIDELSRQIFAYIEINDIPKLEATLEQFQDALCRNGYTAERIKVICITLMMDLKSRIARSFGEKKNADVLGENIIDSVGSMGSLFEIIEMLKYNLSDISNSLFGKTAKSTLERVVQYIKSNYRQELKLEMLSNIFGYNSAYLGKVFHQYTGENFNNYLDSIRITEAKRLLSTEDYKVYEVAEMVGYSNINYFHNKFKKNVGVSPLSYKKTFKDTDEEE